MKICMILEFFVPHYNGGGEHRYYEIAKRLVERGHEVDLLNMKFPNVSNMECIEGINVYHIGPTIKNPPNRSLFDFIRYFFSVSKWLMSHEYDFVDAQAYSPLLSSSLVSRIKKTPIIATIHDTSSDNNDQWLQSENIANLMEKILVNLKFNKIITVSNATKNSLINNFSVKTEIEILYNGVDIQKYDQINVDKIVENQIIFVGRLAPHKHVDHLIKSIQKIEKNIPSIKLVVVGKGEKKNCLTEMVHKKHLENNIIFKENLTDDELITEIKKSELLVLPSTREGFGMVLAEANCCSKPVITYSSGGTVEVVKDEYNGFLIEPGNIEVLTEKIEELLNNRTLKRQMGENGRNNVEQKFNWEKIVDTYINIVEKIL